jgi:hypothetical protein
MVDESRIRERQEEHRRSVEEQAEIVRAIARDISAMDETSVHTRELIAVSRELIARLDRLLAKDAFSQKFPG